MLCAKFGWNWPSGSGEEEENVKSLRERKRRTTDKLWSEKLTSAFGSGELKSFGFIGLPQEIVKPDGSRIATDHFLEMYTFFCEIRTIPEAARQLQGCCKADSRRSYDLTKSHLDTIVGPVDFAKRRSYGRQLHDRRVVASRFPCHIRNTGGSRTNLNEIRLGGVSEVHLRSSPSHEISCIMSILYIVLCLTKCWYLVIVGMVVIAEKGDEKFILICNGDDKRTAIDSLVKSHASQGKKAVSYRLLTTDLQLFRLWLR